MAEIRDNGSNSNKSREMDRRRDEAEERIIEPANLKNSVTTKKRSRLSKFKNSIVKEDAHNVGSWMFTEVFIPKIIDVFVDMLKGGLDMYFYGESRERGSSRRPIASKISYRNYDNYYEDDRRRRDYKDRRDDYYDYDEIKFATREDADDVLNHMWDILNNPRYGKVVRVSDLFDLVKLPGKYTDHNYGWADLRGSYVRRIGSDYIIELPRPIPLD